MNVTTLWLISCGRFIVTRFRLPFCRYFTVPTSVHDSAVAMATKTRKFGARSPTSRGSRESLFISRKTTCLSTDQFSPSGECLSTVRSMFNET